MSDPSTYKQLDTAEMNMLAERLRAGGGELRTEIQQFQALCIQVLDNSWRSISGTAFGEAYRTWQASAEMMIQALEDLSAVTQNASVIFDEADENAKNIVPR